MSFKGFSIFSSGCHFVQPSGSILAILVEGHWRNTSVQIFEIGPLAKEMSFEDFLFLALVAILLNIVEPLWPSWTSSATILASFDPEVTLLLQSKFRLKTTKRDVEN